MHNEELHKSHFSRYPDNEELDELAK